MRLFRRRRDKWAIEPMPDRFHDLARYNGERYRGIEHGDEWKVKMAELQSEYERWKDDAYDRAGWQTIRFENGAVTRIPPS